MYQRMATREHDVRSSFVKAQKTVWLKKSVVMNLEMCGRGEREPRTKKAILSFLQDSLLGLVVFDLAPVTGVSSVPIKPIQCIPATTIPAVCQRINELDINFTPIIS